MERAASDETLSRARAECEDARTRIQRAEDAMKRHDRDARRKDI